MRYSPLTVSRSHVLGGLHTRCEHLEDHIAVYLDDASGEKLGVVDERLGRYADAFTFQLSEEICKMLAGGKFDYSFDYRFSESDSDAAPSSRRRIQLESVFLTERKTVESPAATTDQPPTDQPPTDQPLTDQPQTDQSLIDQPLTFAAID